MTYLHKNLLPAQSNRELLQSEIARQATDLYSLGLWSMMIMKKMLNISSLKALARLIKLSSM